MKYQMFMILFQLFFFASCVNKTNNAEYNIFIFTKTYGYFRYFYPNSEIQKIQWDKFIYFGLNKIKDCKTKQSLIDSLIVIYKPFFNEFEIAERNFTQDYNSAYATGLSDTLMFWQYLGLQSSGKSYLPFKNQIVKYAKGKIISNSVFNEIPKVQYYNHELSPGLNIRFPVVISSNKVGKTNISLPFRKQFEVVNNYNTDTISNITKRLADLVEFWNIIQHFYPYHQESGLDWDNKLTQFITEAQKSTTSNEDYIFKIGHIIKDCHFRINNASYNFFYLPFKAKFINETLIVTQTQHNELNIGDIVLKINNTNVSDLLNEKSLFFSGTEWFIKEYATNYMLAFNKQDSVTVEYKRENKVYYTKFVPDKYKHSNSSKAINNNLYYINLADDGISISNIIIIAGKYKNIIIDMRNGNGGINLLEFFQHLSSDTLVPPFLFALPKILYPDYTNVDYLNTNENIEPLVPKLNNNVVILSSPQCISYSESMIKLAQINKFATIIGERTGGTNGVINYSRLPSGLIIGWTGGKCVNINGSQHHLIGISPDIEVKPTLSGIKAGKDEVLEYAIEYLQKKLVNEK